MKEWIIQNWKIIGSTILGIIGMILIIASTRKKKPVICELDIYEQRKRLRELDKFLSDMQDYFKKVEKLRK